MHLSIRRVQDGLSRQRSFLEDPLPKIVCLGAESVCVYKDEQQTNNLQKLHLRYRKPAFLGKKIKDHLISEDYTASISTALGLRPDTSKFALQVNYCLLLARYHIWLAKTKAIHPNLIRYLHLLKLRYELETQSGDTRKWEPLVEHL